MTTKSPISRLQEYALAKKLPLPQYSELTEKNLFGCIVQLEHITAKGVGTNKKLAKTQAATNALKYLQEDTGTVFPLTSNCSLTSSPIVRNFIGELNEHASKYGVKYADYAMGMCTLNGEFEMICKFLEYETFGKGRNKKDAKQMAAMHMLDRVQDVKITPTPISTIKTALISDNLPDVIEKFKSLNVMVEPINEKAVDIKPQLVDIDEANLTEEYLLEEMTKLNMKYAVKTLFSTVGNHMVCMKAVNSDFTVIGMGATRKESIKDMVRQTLGIIKTGCSFIHDGFL